MQLVNIHNKSQDNAQQENFGPQEPAAALNPGFSVLLSGLDISRSDARYITFDNASELMSKDLNVDKD